MSIKDTLGKAYRAEPIIINTIVAVAVAIAAKYGFDIDADWIIATLFGGTQAVGSAVSRAIVWAPDTVAGTEAKPDVPFGPLSTRSIG